jgi:hypothetical protein
MKLYKIGQPWQNEPLIENKTEFIDNNQARFACQERKISNPKPRTREGCPILSNFSFGVAVRFLMPVPMAMFGERAVA